MASKSSNQPPVQPAGTMSLPSAVIAILIAFVGGLMIGHLTGQGSGASSEEIALAAGDRGGEGAGAGGPTLEDDVERFRVDVSDDMPSRGPDDALVTIVIFSDFQCPFCSRVEPTVERIREHYGDQVRVVWRNNPLPFHDRAGPAAEAAMEAYAQRGDEGFWRMHALLFENQRSLADADLERYATQAGLDMTRFRRALSEHTHQAGITRDQQAANQIGARGTPAFFINGRQLMGAQPYEQFQQVIDDEVRRARASVAAGTRQDQLYAALMRGARTSPAPEEGAGAGAAPTPPPARPQPDPNAVYRVPVGESPARGPADALVTIVLFSEFQCPFCSRVRPTIEQIFETYGRDVRLVFKHNPLPFHPNAMPAAEAASEAYAQRGAEGFWRMHDMLFEHQTELTRENLESYAEQIGLDMARFRRALDEHTHQAAIEADQTLARGLGASGTPSFFINGRNLRGAQPFEAFQRVIDEERTRAQERVRGGTARGRLYEAIIADGATEPVFLPAPAGAAAPSPGGAAPEADRVYEIPVPARAPTRGPARAPVTIQIFSDFQCPFCGRVGPTIEQIMETYEGRVRLIWRNYPLPFHDRATPAAEAAMEVFAQRGEAAFWQFHNILFENQRALTDEDLERYAGQIAGLDMARFRRAMTEHTHQAAIQADMAAVRTAGAEIGTPSFFINGRLLQGAQPFPAFQQAIDRAIREAH